ncbi:MAG: hypothetical protein ABR606_14800 [Vicinamibacterales bacterium]
MKRVMLLVCAGLLIWSPVFSFAQSLADVARAEEARRKNVKKPAKVYTNDALKPDFTTPPSPAAVQTDAAPTPAPATPEPGAPSAPASPSAPAQAEPKGPSDEAAWRKRITTARAELQRSQTFAEALQSRINALTADFVNRDDPAQRAGIDQDRQRALAELERVKNDIVKQTDAIAAIEDEARKAGVPAGWLR